MELVSKATGFLWGYIYVVLAFLNSLLNGWIAIQAFQAGARGLAVAMVVALLIIWTSIYGILRRRRWGLILTSILLGLMLLLSLLQLWQAFQVQMIPGYLPMAQVLPAFQFFYALFFFVYFLRRRKLFA